MDTEQVLREIRVLLGDALASIGDAAPSFTDEYLLELVHSASAVGAATGVLDTHYSVSAADPAAEASFSALEITPEPSLIDGLILAAFAVYRLVSGDLQSKVANGDLGVRFKTGLEEISTVEAARHMDKASTNLLKHVRYLITIKLSGGGRFTSRVQ
jgi:hypothetical protein